MGVYDVMSALLVDIRNCIGDTNCNYDMFVSMGEPPATGCNQIFSYFDGNALDEDSSDSCLHVYVNRIIFGITRCCNYDGEIEFDHIKEDQEAQCFLRDLEAMQSCLICNSGSIVEALYPQFCADDVKIEAAQVDADRAGGCYTAFVSLAFVDQICCP